MDLQGTDAWRQVDHAVQVFAFQRLHQGVGAEAQDQIEFRSADFQQQVGVAGQARHQPRVVQSDIQHHRRLNPLWERACSR
ncbi:hypothetical protein D3C81_2063970 [compost metagenome]